MGGEYTKAHLLWYVNTDCGERLRLRDCFWLEPALIKLFGDQAKYYKMRTL